MPFKLAIYDYNGTLVRDTLIAYRCVCHLFKIFAPGRIPPSLGTYRSEINNSDWTEFFYQYGISRTTSILEMLNVWFPHYRSIAHSDALSLNHGARNLLSFCEERGLLNAIVTQSKENIGAYLVQLKVHSYFNRVEINTLNGWNKEIGIGNVVRHFSVASEEAFYIDDTFDGLTHAKRAGVRTIGFTDGLHTEERIRAAKPDYVVDSLLEVIDILKS